MENIKVNLENAKTFEKNIMKYAEQVKSIHNTLHSKADDENEFCGWLNLPTEYDKFEFARIKLSAEKIQKDSDVLLVIGIGKSAGNIVCRK